MKIRYCLGLLSIIAAVVAMVSCSKNAIDDYPMGMAPKSMSPTGLALGNRLENAYTVRNMTAAWHSLFGSDSRCPLGATHYYVKILPQDSTDVTRLVEDTTLCLFPYPLDYELIGEGMYELDSTDTAWVYTVVPVGYNLSGLTYTVIDTCCIPDDGDTLLERVEERSLKLTGNIPQNQPRVSGRPSGYIKAYNTNAREYEGVRRVKVVMNSLVKVRSVYTQENGFYTCPVLFLSNVAYTICFQNRQGYQVWYNWYCLIPATHYMGIHSPSGYNANFNSNSLTAWYLSTINNAAYIYYNTIVPHNSLTSPYQDLRILAWGNSSFGQGSTPLLHHRLFAPAFVDTLSCLVLPGNVPAAVYMHMKLLPDMLIADRTYKTKQIYNIVFHEMSHASHFMKVGNSFWSMMVIGSIRLANVPGYGNGTSFNAQYVGVAEMWAYWAGYKAEEYYWKTFQPDVYQSNEFEIKIGREGEWFHPELLDSICNTVPYYNNMGVILNTYSPLSTNLCAVKGSLVLNAPFSFGPIINNILNPVCSTSF